MATRQDADSEHPDAPLRLDAALAGGRDDVLVADRLGVVFGVAIEAIERGRARRFVVVPDDSGRESR